MKLKQVHFAIVISICAFILIGVFGILAPAFHYLPAIEAHVLSLSPWYALFDTPEFLSSIRLTLISGLAATIISFMVAFSVVAAFYQSWILRLFQKSLAPILAVPHAAIAIGLLFLLSPSGWLIRLFTTFDRPPNWITVQDPYTLSLILALVIKETPYLIFVMLACLHQVKADESLNIGRSMGYHSSTVWQKILLPAMYPLIRLPIFIVLAFSLTVVDLALIIGPNTPSTFAVTVFRWFKDADLNERFVASSGAVLLMLLVFVVFLLWECTYRLIVRFTKQTRIQGIRQSFISRLYPWIGSLYFVLLLFVSLAGVILFIWSFAKRWRFPDVLPSTWSLANLERNGSLLFELSWNTLSVGIVSALLALVISIILLEVKRAQSIKTTFFDRLIYVPILLPQVGFLFGIQIFFIRIDFSGHLPAVITLHLFYVLPYVYLTLHSAYLAYNQNYFIQACALTQKPVKSFFQIKLAMLKAPIFSAFAIGFSVSIAQYLPTLIAGNGLISTLTTEAVTLASSGERKIVSLLALMQSIFPLIVFMLAIWLPKVWTPARIKCKQWFARLSLTFSFHSIEKR
ncbi:ABC transporter permease [Marinomonas sp. 2405UD68-3]|uniref:ABC transporter permease n=1 Tax=Marinomonas sp. 2405UD68-3 TaxID=3391835 RepID=UPI0039C8F58B